MVRPVYHIDERTSEVLEAAADGIRRSADLADVMNAIAASALPAAKSLEAIEQDLLKITADLHRGKR